MLKRIISISLFVFLFLQVTACMDQSALMARHGRSLVRGFSCTKFGLRNTMGRARILFSHYKSGKSVEIEESNDVSSAINEVVSACGKKIGWSNLQANCGINQSNAAASFGITVRSSYIEFVSESKFDESLDCVLRYL